MTLAQPLPLFSQLPRQLSPERPYCDLYTLIPSLLDLYPDWSEDDVRGFVEEKLNSRLHPEETLILRALYARLAGLRREFGDGAESAGGVPAST